MTRMVGEHGIIACENDMTQKKDGMVIVNILKS
jgi:hypothetical protein